MKTSLYQIENNYLEIAQQLLDNGGEITPELEEALAITEKDLQTKGINYGFVIKQMEGECNIIDSEIKRLQSLKKSRVNSIDRLKSNISKAMDLFGIEEIKIPLLKLNFRKSESVEVENINLLPAEYIVCKEVITADKEKIKASIKNGIDVQGAILKQNKNLQIK